MVWREEMAVVVRAESIVCEVTSGQEGSMGGVSPPFGLTDFD